MVFVVFINQIYNNNKIFTLNYIIYYNLKIFIIFFLFFKKKVWIVKVN
jgi:hypothetical protein